MASLAASAPSAMRVACTCRNSDRHAAEQGRDADHSDQPEVWERKGDVQGPDHPRQWTGHLLVFSEYSRIELWMNPDATDSCSFCS